MTNNQAILSEAIESFLNGLNAIKSIANTHAESKKLIHIASGVELYISDLQEMADKEPKAESSDSTKPSVKEFKYHPKSNEDLQKLVKLKKVNLGEIDVSAVSDFSELFLGSVRSDFSGIESWDVSHVTNMSSMFNGAENFNADISGWDVSNVTNMESMFEKAGSFNQSLENWNVSNVTNMKGMFCDARSFNQPLEKWDVSSVTDMSSMFENARSFNQPLNDWDVLNVLNMDSMFRSSSFNQPLKNWDVSKVRNINSMFMSTSFQQNLESWNIASVDRSSMCNVFYWSPMSDKEPSWYY